MKDPNKRLGGAIVFVGLLAAIVLLASPEGEEAPPRPAPAVTPAMPAAAPTATPPPTARRTESRAEQSPKVSVAAARPAPEPEPEPSPKRASEAVTKAERPKAGKVVLERQPEPAAEPEPASDPESVADLEEPSPVPGAAPVPVPALPPEPAPVAVRGQFVDRTGSSFELVRVTATLDGRGVYSGAGGSSFALFQRTLPPGTHQLSILAEYRGRSGGLISYTEGFGFTVRSGRPITVHPGRPAVVTATAFERGGPTDPMHTRLGLSISVR